MGAFSMPELGDDSTHLENDEGSIPLAGTSAIAHQFEAHRHRATPRGRDLDKKRRAGAAMKREDLKALGLTDEQVEAVMTEHGKAIAAENAKTTASATTVKELQDQLKERDKDIAELKKSSGDNADLTKKYEDLESKYKADTKALEQKLADQQLEAALDAAITEAKGKNPKAIKALLDREKISLKDGKLNGLDLKAIKESDAYLFDSDEAAEPKVTGMTPGRTNTGGGNDPGSLREALALEMGQKG